MSNQQVSPISAFSGFMEKLKPQMALALPKHLTADRMARLTLTAFSTNPELQKCSHQSIAASIMTAVQLGLEPNVNGAGYLIPYKGTCTFVPGWKGLVDLVGRSGRGTVYTGVIFEDQIQGRDWEFFDGSRRELIIKTQSSLVDDKKITHAYAIGWVKDSAMPIIELWSVAKLNAHRDKFNKVGSRHYSFANWEMYCRKIPLLQVIKYMPCSIELSMAVDVTNVSEVGGNASIIDGIVVSQYHEDNNATTEIPKKDDPYALGTTLSLIENTSSLDELKAIDMMALNAKDQKVAQSAWMKKKAELQPKQQPQALSIADKINACTSAQELNNLIQEINDESVELEHDALIGDKYDSFR